MRRQQAVFDGVAGVQPQTETVWRQADKYKVSRMCFLNKMDRTGANFCFCVQTIIDVLGSTPALLQLPIGTSSDFLGIVDLVTMETVVWRGENLGASFDRIPLAESNDLPLRHRLEHEANVPLPKRNRHVQQC